MPALAYFWGTTVDVLKRDVSLRDLRSMTVYANAVTAARRAEADEMRARR